MKLRIIKKVTGTVKNPKTEYIIQEKTCFGGWNDRKESFVYEHHGNGNYRYMSKTPFYPVVFNNAEQGLAHAEAYLIELQHPFILEYQHRTIKKSLFWPLYDGRYVFYVDMDQYIMADFDLDKLKLAIDGSKKLDSCTVIKEIEI